MTLDAIDARLARDHLETLGILHSTPEDGLGEGTIVLVGPRDPGFWSAVTASDEWQDGAGDPMDRWSTRVITGAADDLGAVPLFPFGRPVRPFFTWALRSGRLWASPVMLLVHHRAGLMVSFRGALFVPRLLPLPAPVPRPCDTCDGQPCLAACPVGALTGDGYDLPACHAFLDSPEGDGCMTQGCAVRRACPISRTSGRMDAQSAYHMRQFHK